jgi:hypothetical protein
VMQGFPRTRLSPAGGWTMAMLVVAFSAVLI